MPIEARGKKDLALAARIKAGVVPDEAEPDWEYVVGRRPLRVGKETRQPGDPVPEAASWGRLESWLRSGAIERRPAGRRTVSAGPTRPVRQRQPEPAREEQTTAPVLRPIRRDS